MKQKGMCDLLIFYFQPYVDDTETKTTYSISMTTVQKIESEETSQVQSQSIRVLEQMTITMEEDQEVSYLS